MALFDIDKNTGDRSQPTPNSHDQLSIGSIQAKGTNSVNYVTPATTQSALIGAKNGQSTIVAKGVFGPIQSNNQFTIPNPGASLYQATTVLVASAAHNLPFVPGVIAYYGDSENGWSMMPLSSPSALGGVNTLGRWVTLRISVDATNVYWYWDEMYFTSAGVNGDNLPAGITITYYLTQQTSS